MQNKTIQWQLLQQQIIQSMRVLPQIDATYEIDRRVSFIKRCLKATEAKTLVLGISGGQDSTLAGKLCQLAVEQYRAESPNSVMTIEFIALRQPYGQQADEADCQLALQFIQPDKTLTTNIKASVDQTTECLMQTGVAISDFHKGNIKARIRMTLQYAVAGQTQGLVVGTDHSAENITGFFTKHGDGAADLVPLFGLNKRQGRLLLQTLDCPEVLYLKPPTADLEDLRPLYQDEAALGLSYDSIDDYLENKPLNPADQARIEQLYQQSAHKRQLPITIYD